MPYSFQSINLGPIRHLLDIWALRYCPDFSPMEASARSIIIGEIEQSLSASGRKQTAATLNQKNVMDACHLAAIRIKDIHTHFGDLDVQTITNLGQLTSRVYLQLIELYRLYPSKAQLTDWQQKDIAPEQLGNLFRIENLLNLADALEPFLAELRLQRMISQGWQTLGFITTHISLTNELLLKQLSPVEKALISPHFKFLEEQIIMPWQRLFVAAGEATSPSIQLVERMVPVMPKIAMAAHDQWHQEVSHCRGCRDNLTQSQRQSSSLRDFTLFQVYLWLSFLQRNAMVLERELVVFCHVIYGEIGIPWEITTRGVEILSEQILDCLEPHEHTLAASYLMAMVQAFMAGETVGATLYKKTSLSPVIN